MLNQATMDMLTAMKMTAMAAEFANQLKDPTFNELGFEERLGLLVNAEWNRRQSNKLNRFIRNARFAVPSATVEGIEYYEDRKRYKAQTLRLSTYGYIDEGHYVILKGASGNGNNQKQCNSDSAKWSHQSSKLTPQMSYNHTCYSYSLYNICLFSRYALLLEQSFPAIALSTPYFRCF